MDKLTLKDPKMRNLGAIICGIGFILYLVCSALEWEMIAEIVSVVFALISLYVFICCLSYRRENKDNVSYSLLWGTFAFAIMFWACAYLGAKLLLNI